MIKSKRNGKLADSVQIPIVLSSQNKERNEWNLIHKEDRKLHNDAVIQKTSIIFNVTE